MRAWTRDNSLSIFFFVLFLAAVIGEAIAGHSAHNNDQLAHGEATVSLWEYVRSSAFGQAVMENWQSEYLQFMLLMLATVWLIQRGSPESKPPGEGGVESARRQRIGGWAGRDAPAAARAGGIRAAVYSNSLLIVMAFIFLGSWFAQSVTGWTDFNEQQAAHGEAPISWTGYLGSAEFWEATLQNWQSEFLAVGSFAAFTIYLRQRGSPESKPVGAPHTSTGVEG